MLVFSFGNTILLRSVDTGTLVNYTMTQEITIKNGVEMLFGIVSFQNLDFCLELCLDHGVEGFENLVCL